MLVKLLSESRTATVSSSEEGLGMYKALGSPCSCADLLKAAGRGRKLRYAPREFVDFVEAEAELLSRRIAAFLRTEREHVVSEVLTAFGKGGWTDDVVDWRRWLALVPVLNKALSKGCQEGRDWGAQLLQVQKVQKARGVGVGASVSLVHEAAAAWAAARAGFLVGMRRTATGDYVPNPNADLTITATTRKELRTLVTEAILEGWSTQRLAEELQGLYSFSDARAMTIARTEIAFAHTSGSLMQWKESGVVEKKQSILGSEHDLDDVCDGNAEEGAIPLEQPFASGHQGPPYHPNCVCALIPVTGRKGPGRFRAKMRGRR
jgi:hypothetical protein